VAETTPTIDLFLSKIEESGIADPRNPVGGNGAILPWNEVHPEEIYKGRALVMALGPVMSDLANSA
jgi:hypothetical protein